MKKNTSKIIPLLSLILLSSCNDITYKDGNPLFIEGESIKADDSVKQEFLEKTKGYNNFIPDGTYSISFSCDMFYKGEKVHFYDVEGCFEYSSCEIYTYAVLFYLNFHITKYKIKKVYSSNDIFDSLFRNENYRFIENSLIYDGNTYAEEEIFKYSPSKKEYFTNLSENYLATFTFFDYYNYFKKIEDFNFYFYKNIYHFHQDFPKKDPIWTLVYLEDIGFNYSDDFNKLYEISYNLIAYDKPYYIDMYNLEFSSTIYSSRIKMIDNLDLELPDLTTYTFNQDNSHAVPFI